MSNDRATVVRGPYGVLRWHVRRGGKLVRRWRLKRLAKGHAAMLNGEAQDAPAFYRAVVADNERSYGLGYGEEAWREAAYLVRVYYGPGEVNSDPETGEPLS